MRSTIAIILGFVLAAPACSKGENAGVEEAKKEAEKEQKEKESHGEAAKKIVPPVPGRAHVPCTQLINTDQFTQGLAEKDPVAVAESKSEPDAAASCSVLRGGKRLSEAEQKALIKKEGRLGVMPATRSATSRRSAGRSRTRSGSRRSVPRPRTRMTTRSGSTRACGSSRRAPTT